MNVTPADVTVGSRWRGVLDTFEVVAVDGDRAQLKYLDTYRHTLCGPWWEAREDIANGFTFVRAGA